MFIQIFITIAAVANIPGCLAGLMDLQAQALLAVATQAIYLSGLEIPAAFTSPSAIIGLCTSNPYCMGIMVSIYQFIMANPTMLLWVAVSLFTSLFGWFYPKKNARK